LKILVTTKRVPDPDQKIRIRDDARGIDEDGVSFVMNPFDAIAVEEAVRIAERIPQQEVEILAAAICADTPDAEKELREALAMGADRAILVPCEAAPDPWNVAQILKALVEREQPDLVLMGKQAIDDDSNQAGQFLAALLAWPQATFASQIEFGQECLVVARETDGGLETVRITLPAVITTDLRLNEPRYASLPSIMKAKRKPLDRIGIDELGITIEPRIQLLHLELTSTERDCVIVDSLDELMEQLGVS